MSESPRLRPAVVGGVVVSLTGALSAHDTAVFAAFAPAEGPQYAVSVVLEEGRVVGSVAVPGLVGAVTLPPGSG